MNPDTIPAGPELDRLIAEKVMGWELERTKDGRFERWNRKDGNGCAWYPMPKIGEHHGEHWFAPSTNMAHAIDVMNAVTSKITCFVEIKHPIKLCEIVPLSMVRFHSGGWGKLHAVAVETSLQTAICRAALKAVGEKEKQP
jgi:hypothetical protein